MLKKKKFEKSEILIKLCGPYTGGFKIYFYSQLIINNKKIIQ